jgi:FkbM family methyltransferase
MSTERFIAYLLKSVYLEDEIRLIDVGASGGLHNRWHLLGDRIRGIGFDPLVNEVDRLNRENTLSKFVYQDAFVIGDQQAPANIPDSMEYSSAQWAVQLMGVDYEKENFNQGAEWVLTENTFTLDDYLSSESLSPNFLKSDTDGSDYFVLQGARRLLASKELLGVEVECNLHGSADTRSNTFSNIDFLLRSHGFTLFDLRPWKYTKRDLPGRFVYPIPAQTSTGQVQWADAVYFRDPTASSEDARYFFSPGNLEITLKLLVALVLYEQEDTAARVINLMRAKQCWPKQLDHNYLLNQLVPKNKWAIESYSEYIEKFSRSPKEFYPRQDNISKVVKALTKRFSD